VNARRPWRLWISIIILGCTKSDPNKAGAQNGSGADTGDTRPPASIAWTETDIIITTEQDEPRTGNLFFGFAETDGCGEDCWTGEDCFLGAVLNDDEKTRVQYCHPLPPSGTRLQYGGERRALAVGRETAFKDATAASRVTLVVEDVAKATCWTWGANPTYYESLRCIDR